MSRYAHPSRVTASQLRRKQEARKGFALCFAVASLFAVTIGAAAYIDHSRGVTVSQSLASAGL